MPEHEHQEALAETLEYDWVAQAVLFAGGALVDDLVDVIERSLADFPPADPLSRQRLRLLLEAFGDVR